MLLELMMDSIRTTHAYRVKAENSASLLAKHTQERILKVHNSQAMQTGARSRVDQDQPVRAPEDLRESQVANGKTTTSQGQAEAIYRGGQKEVVAQVVSGWSQALVLFFAAL